MPACRSVAAVFAVAAVVTARGATLVVSLPGNNIIWSSYPICYIAASFHLVGLIADVDNHNSDAMLLAWCYDGCL